MPRSLAGHLSGPPIYNARGDALDAHIHLMLTLDRATQRGPLDWAPAAARERMRSGIRLIQRRPTAVHSITPLLIAGRMSGRLYQPDVRRPPLVVFFHGGGWVTGDLETHDHFCRRLCAGAQVAVAAVDYRLAPEAPFPAAIEDAGAAWADLRARAESLGADPDRVAVAGDSAGGNLAAVVCQRVRDGRVDAPLPQAQVLIYPSTDFRRQTDSHREFATGFLLTSESIDAYKAAYAAPDDLDPDASPLLRPDLTGLPDAVISTAGFDPLRDEGEHYADALRAAGVACTHLAERRLIHGYLQMDAISAEADRAVGRLIDATAAALGARR